VTLQAEIDSLGRHLSTQTNRLRLYQQALATVVAEKAELTTRMKSLEDEVNQVSKQPTKESPKTYNSVNCSDRHQRCFIVSHFPIRSRKQSTSSTSHKPAGTNTAMNVHIPQRTDTRQPRNRLPR